MGKTNLVSDSLFLRRLPDQKKEKRGKLGHAPDDLRFALAECERKTMNLNWRRDRARNVGRQLLDLFQKRLKKGHQG